MIGGGSKDLGGEGGPLGVVDLIRMEARRQPMCAPGKQHSAGLIGVEHALLAEHVAEASDALLRDAGQLVPDDVLDVRVDGIGPTRSSGGTAWAPR